MKDDLYLTFQPVTWAIGVVNAQPSKVADAVAFADPRAAGTAPKHHVCDSLDEALQALEPLFCPARLAVVPTRDGRAVLFCNLVSVTTIAEYATWSAAEACETRAFFVLRVPNTISPDQKSGEWGGRQLTVRDPETPFGKEATFDIYVMNDCGRWIMERIGEAQPFEEHEAYKARHVKNRFTDDMLLRYCSALGIPIHDRSWYCNEYYLVDMKPITDTSEGMTFHQARRHFRIDSTRI